MRRALAVLPAFISTCMFGQSPDYGGPSLLGGGEAPSNLQQPVQTGFRPYIILNQIYDSGAAIGLMNSAAPGVDTGAFGIETDAGVSVYHHWKQVLLEVAYRGAFRRYSQKTVYDGSDHSLDLRFEQQFNPHARLSIKESAGAFASAFGVTGGLPFVNPEFQSSPSQELSANRVNYLGTQAVFTYQVSPRLAFSEAADGFFVHRQASALYGETGYIARSELAYRMTRHTTVGAQYSYTHFGMNRFLGMADVHTVAFEYSTRLSRTWEAAVQMGVSRAETLGVVTVTVDPAVAAIIGRTAGFETAYEKTHVPTLTARASKSFHRGVVQLQYLHGITPGNGLWSASATNGLTTSYAYTGLTRWNLQMSFGYSSMSDLLRSTGSYGGYNGSASAARAVEKNCQLIARFDWRQYDVTRSILPDSLGAANRMYYRMTIGVEFGVGQNGRL